MGGPGAALFLGVNMTTVSWGQKALILFRGLECAGEGEYKDRVGAGWCLRRAASLGFREPPPPARGQTGGVGQLREVMHRGLPTGPRPWGAGPDCSFLLVPWTPGSSWGWDGGKRGGGDAWGPGLLSSACSPSEGSFPGHYACASSGVCLEHRPGPDPTPWGLVCHVSPGGGGKHGNETCSGAEGKAVGRSSTTGGRAPRDGAGDSPVWAAEVAGQS